MLINHESSVGAFPLIALFTLLLPFTYHLFPALAEYQP
jgi:hypothetical protein